MSEKNYTLAIAVTAGRGGKEFERECKAFADHHRAKGDEVLAVFLSHKRQWQLRRAVLRAIRAFPYPRLDRIAFFCHGTPKWLRCGFHRWNVDELAGAISEHTDEVDVALYACSTGRARGEWPWKLTARSWELPTVPGTAGFAARLTGALLAIVTRARVFAHGTPGHTTRNPYSYYFSRSVLDNSMLVRMPVVLRGTPEWKDWKEKLKTDFRFDVPFYRGGRK